MWNRARAAAEADGAQRRPPGRGEEGCGPRTFGPPWKYERSRPKGLPHRRPARGERVCPPPPLPHFRLPPLPRSRLPGPVRPGGDPAAQPHPGGPLAPTPPPLSRRSGQTESAGAPARQELPWTRTLGRLWSASSSACGSGRSSLRTSYSRRRSSSSPCLTCISRPRDPP